MIRLFPPLVVLVALVARLSPEPCCVRGDFPDKTTCLLILGKERKRALSGKEMKEIIGQENKRESDQNTRIEEVRESDEIMVQHTVLRHETY